MPISKRIWRIKSSSDGSGFENSLGLNDNIALIELSELVRSLCTEWRLPSETLVDNRSNTPQVGFTIVRLRHYHLRRLSAHYITYSWISYHFNVKYFHFHLTTVNSSVKNSRAIWDHTVLPATRHKCTHTAIIPARQTGRYSMYLPQRDGRLTCPRWLFTQRDVYLTYHANSNQLNSSLLKHGSQMAKKIQ